MYKRQIRENGRRIGLRMHFRVKPWTDFVEVHWSKGEQAYVTPVAAEEVCIALLGCAREAGFANLADRFPRLGERLRGACLLYTSPRLSYLPALSA